MLKSHLENRTESSLSSFPLSAALLSIITSSLDPAQISSVISFTLEGYEAESRDNHADVLGEALVDVVEMMEEEKEDCEDLRKSEGMDVDEPKIVAGSKSLQVLKLLLVSPPVYPVGHGLT